MIAYALSVAENDWPLTKPFRISRGTRTHASTVTVTISDGQHSGRGECVPYARYGESLESVVGAIWSFESEIKKGLNRIELQKIQGPGAARNAIDCALWDLACKQTGLRAWTMAGLPKPAPTNTALTISLDEPTTMAETARIAASPILKIKLDGLRDLECVEAVRGASQAAVLIVDPNESWTFQQLQEITPALKMLGVSWIEQPLPAGSDACLQDYRSPIPICADESIHTVSDLAQIAGKYSAINIKLDKTGGLTAALTLAREAQNLGLSIMVGSMVSTSLSMAPAFMLSSFAHFVDLDSPLLLSKDRIPPIPREGTKLFSPPAELWG